MKQIENKHLKLVGAGKRDDCVERSDKACKEMGGKAGKAYDEHVPGFAQRKEDRERVVRETEKACKESIEKAGVCKP